MQTTPSRNVRTAHARPRQGYINHLQAYIAQSLRRLRREHIFCLRRRRIFPPEKTETFINENLFAKKNGNLTAEKIKTFPLKKREGVVVGKTKTKTRNKNQIKAPTKTIQFRGNLFHYQKAKNLPRIPNQPGIGFVCGHRRKLNRSKRW